MAFLWTRAVFNYRVVLWHRPSSNNKHLVWLHTGTVDALMFRLLYFESSAFLSVPRHLTFFQNITIKQICFPSMFFSPAHINSFSASVHSAPLVMWSYKRVLQAHTHTQTHTVDVHSQAVNKITNCCVLWSDVILNHICGCDWRLIVKHYFSAFCWRLCWL